jgi:hypothetical protein
MTPAIVKIALEGHVMRHKRVIVVLAVLLASASARAGVKMDAALTARLDTALKGMKYAVLAKDGVPARAKGDGILDKSVTLQVRNGGAWEQKAFLGVKDSKDITANLDKGELFKIVGYKTVKDGVNLSVETVATHNAGAEWSRSGKGRSRYSDRLDYLRTSFEFRFDDESLADSQTNVDRILAAVEGYVKCFASESDAQAFAAAGGKATAEIKLGMAEGEVTKALGAPKRRLDLGEKVTLLYDDMTVILRNGKVADVELK